MPQLCAKGTYPAARLLTLNQFKTDFLLFCQVYSTFGFDFSVQLSTRPEKYLGDLTLWDKV